MNKKERQSRIRTLIWLLIPGAAYSIVYYFHIPLTGIHQWDGIGGVLLGLFMCAHPAANFLDVILFRRSGSVSYKPGGIESWTWGILNAGVVFIGWLDIVDGLLIFSLPR